MYFCQRAIDISNSKHTHFRKSFMQTPKINQLPVQFLLMASAAVFSANALAGSVLDGVYSCSVSVPGLGISTVYQTINTNGLGQTVTAPANVTANTAVMGYGLGTVTGYTLSGTTDKGQPFSFTLNPVTLTASGTFNLVGSNGLLPTAYSCTKFW